MLHWACALIESAQAAAMAAATRVIAARSSFIFIVCFSGSALNDFGSANSVPNKDGFPNESETSIHQPQIHHPGVAGWRHDPLRPQVANILRRGRRDIQPAAGHEIGTSSRH